MEKNKPEMIDDTTCIIKTLIVLGRKNEETGEIQAEALEGHVISTLDAKTGVATMSVNLVNEKGVQMSMAFWPVAELMNMQIERMIKARTAEESGKE